MGTIMGTTVHNINKYVVFKNRKDYIREDKTNCNCTKMK